MPATDSSFARTDRIPITVVGAGVVGLAIARALVLSPQLAGRTVVLLEQENSPGQHTSSRNSEVIHAGIYYPTESLKARLCVRGRQLLYAYCRQYDIPHRRTGKLIVGSAGEIAALERLYRQGLANGVDDLDMLDSGDIHSLEPAVQASAALLSPSSGIIDSHALMASLLQQAQSAGVIFAPNTRVASVAAHDKGLDVICQIGPEHRELYRFTTSIFVNAAGLEANRLAGCVEGLNPATIPDLFLCKGDYFAYTGANPFSRLIYPIPEAGTAGLGVHATLDLSGRLRFGPDVEYVDSVRYTIEPAKSTRFADAIKRYFPAIDSNRLVPDYSGVRPKLAGPGQPAADFVIQGRNDHGVPGLIQLFGIESPGLTASLAIAEEVSEQVCRYF